MIRESVNTPGIILRPTGVPHSLYKIQGYNMRQLETDPQGIYKSMPYFEGTSKTKITELAEWAKESCKIVTF